MKDAAVLRLAWWVLPGVVTAGACWPGMAQSPLPRQSKVQFSSEKPVTGLPPQSSRSAAHCSADNTAFFNVSASSKDSDVMGVAGLYRISPNGEVKQLMRKLPMEFSSVSMRDFYVGDQTLVTMLEAVKRADDMDAAVPPLERGYFLSVSDRDGDLASLVRMDVRFRPMKIAVFGSGEFLVLGWDEANLLPIAAILKVDGSVRRFLDLDDPRLNEVRYRTGTVARALPAAREHVTLEEMQAAVFVPYGNDVLLTYPGTAKAVRVLTEVGDGRSIPILLPGGWVLQDVLVTTPRENLIVRIKPAAGSSKPAADDTDKEKEPQRRLFEMSSYDGKQIQEFKFDKPGVSEVVCAANYRLMAIFYDSISGDGRGASASAGAQSSVAPDAATQLVVATTRR